MPALRLDAALIHLNRADAAGNGQYLGPDPYFDDLFCLAAARAYLSCERLVPTASLLESGPPQSLLVNRAMVDGVVEAPGRRALHQLRAGLRPRRGVPGPRTRRRPPIRTAGRGSGPSTWPATRPATSRPCGGSPRARRAPASRRRRRDRPRRTGRRQPRPASRPGPRSAWWPAPRRGGATATILASPMGLIPGPGRPAGAAHLRPRPAAHRRRGYLLRQGRTARRHRGLAAVPLRVHDGGRGPAARDDGRGADRPVTATRTSPASATGPGPGPSCSACAARPATPSTTRSATGCPGTRPASSSSGWTWSAASATTGRPAWARGRPLPRAARGRDQPGGAGLPAPRITPCGCARSIRASRSARSSPPPASRWPSRPRCRTPGGPTAEELALIRDRLDPAGRRDKELP